MKIIFLDIQGVLHLPIYSRKLKTKGLNPFDDYGPTFAPNCVKNLQTIIETTQAKIVISSTWRLMGEHRLQAMWKDRQLPGEIIGLTPSIQNVKRGDEIAHYLKENGHQNAPPQIIQYLIIDDNNTMLKTQQDNFVQTDSNLGITQTDVQKAINILQAK